MLYVVILIPAVLTLASMRIGVPLVSGSNLSAKTRPNGCRRARMTRSIAAFLLYCMT